MANRNWALEEFFRVERIAGVEVLVGLAEGNLPNGTRVRKVRSLLGDGHQNGALGTVVGALEANDEIKAELRRRAFNGVEWMYWVVWDDQPGVSVAITDNRIEAV